MSYQLASLARTGKALSIFLTNSALPIIGDIISLEESGEMFPSKVRVEGIPPTFASSLDVLFTNRTFLAQLLRHLGPRRDISRRHLLLTDRLLLGLNRGVSVADPALLLVKNELHDFLRVEFEIADLALHLLHLLYLLLVHGDTISDTFPSEKVEVDVILLINLIHFKALHNVLHFENVEQFVELEPVVLLGEIAPGIGRGEELS